VDAFTVSHLDLQLELNTIRPYVYTHDDTVANYSHYNQPLAHPLGANLKEIISVIRYQPIFPLTIQWRFTLSYQGNDTTGSNWGGNIFIPTTESSIETIYGNETGQGVVNHLLLSELYVSYMIRHNIFIDMSYGYRRTKNDFTGIADDSHIFQVGIRMNTTMRTFQF
jgi:hypothetical protein